jgi:hypothetical protein
MNASAISQKEAKKLSLRADFERLYWRREELREKRGVATPEQIGALEAREIAALNRSLGIWPK